MLLIVPLFFALGAHQIGAFPIIGYVWFRWFQKLLVLSGITHALLTSNYNFFMFKHINTFHTNSSNLQVRYKANLKENSEKVIICLVL
jgi:hypothetical protein